MGRNLNPEAKARLDATLIATYGDVATGTAPCVWCGLTLDIVAGEHERDRRAPGGSYAADNVGPACPTCNADRGNATTGEWSDAHRTHRPTVTADRDAGLAILTARREARGRASAEAAGRRARLREQANR